MADDFEDKTEDASSKKLSDARAKGKVAKSQDLNAGAMLFFGLMALGIVASQMYQGLEEATVVMFSNLYEPIDTYEAVVGWVQYGVVHTMVLMGPLFAVLFVLAFIVNAVQVGLEITPESLNPHWEKINIFDWNNYKRFFNMQAVVRLCWGVSKIVIIGFGSYFWILQTFNETSTYMHSNAEEMMVFLAQKSLWLCLIIALFLLIIGIIDVSFQKWKFAQDMKMTKHEVKEERKQLEGDVLVKSKMRSMMQNLAKARVKSQVKKSDVIIANPTHFAIAIHYEVDTMPAPICMAKGARLMALKIKDLGKEFGVPIVEMPPLARALYQAVEVGDHIPPQFYLAVAEVLAYVYKVDKRGQMISQTAIEKLR